MKKKYLLYLRLLIKIAITVLSWIVDSFLTESDNHEQVSKD